MSVIFLVLPLALVLSALAVTAFLWAAHRGQFDDLKTPAMRILHDEGTQKRPAHDACSDAGVSPAPKTNPRRPS